jgi:type I restriction enzyme S subunit
MSEWKEYKLGEIADVQTGPFGSQLHMSDYQNEGTPIITVEHLGDNRIIHNNLPLVGDEDKNRLRKYVLSEGDIVFSRVGSVDRRAYVSAKEDGWMFSGRCLRVRPSQKADAKFLSYYFGLEDFKETIRRIAVGATMPSINTTILSNVVVPLPPIDTQRRISAILSSLDDKIDLLHRENATLEQMAETLFRQWFVVEAKEEWEEGKLGDYVDVVDNRGKTPPYINNVTEYPIIEVNALTGNERYVNYDAVRKYVTKEVRDYWFRGHFQKNDILVSTVGSIGELAMCLEDKGVIAQNVIALHASKISPFYLYQYLLLNKDDLKGLDIGSVQPSIKVPHLLRMPIVLPPINLLNKYDSIMVEVIEKEKNNNKQIQTLIQTRDGLLPKLMSNEIAL